MTHRSATLGIAGALAIAGALVMPGAAFATSDKNPPGDNGTIKIHDVATDEDAPENNPKVCKFRLDAFNFDTLQSVDWTIVGWAPTKDLPGTSGKITLASGNGQTGVISLPDGHYKLDWTFEGEKGDGKHKVFWVKCEPETTTGGPTTGGPTTGGETTTGGPTTGGETTGGPTTGGPTTGGETTTGGTTTGGSTTTGTTGSASTSGGAATGGDTPQGGDSTSLASTGGIAVGGIAGVGALLVGGGYLLRRFRGAQG